MRNAIILLLFFGLLACNQTEEKSRISQNGKQEISNNYCRNSEYLAQSVLWFQRSPEMQALYLQSYNNAKKALFFNIKHKNFPNKKNAVVVDIDETILNNSLYEGWLYINDKAYSDSSWNVWVNESKAEPLPGTIDFLNYAKKLGCEIFYVSNRKKDTQLEQTILNLRKYNLPNADENHLLLKTKGDTTLTGRTTKEKRRLKIENELSFEILLLCGDQVADFDKAFDIAKGATEGQIKDSVNKYQDLFSKRFIIIPNPMYSDWLNTIVRGSDRNDSCLYLDKLRKAKISNWK
jgi:5'-nucleotidase (lipoprotein e(P4) family)